MAIVAFVVSFFVSIAGLILGIVALRQLRTRNQRGRGLALASLFVSAFGIAAGIALFAVFLFGGASLVSSLTGVGPSATASEGPRPAAPTFSAAEKAKADAAVASGGGAIPGHIVSGELCRSITAFEEAAKGKPTTGSVDPAVLSAMTTLASVPSPNRIVYEKMVGLTRDPASVTSIVAAQAIAADFAKAIQVDVTTCA